MLASPEQRNSSQAIQNSTFSSLNSDFNDKYHTMTHPLLVFSRDYRLHSLVPQQGLPLLDGHASDR
jgi:hypothetical protein